MGYDFKSIEEKWEKVWDEKKAFKTDTYDFSKPKFFVMDMFPYPSAVGLHVGHVEGYTATDALARMKRMQGFNVLHPIGYDAFGLPAEQFAIKNNKNPGPYTDQNIDNFRTQLKRLGFSYDWDREIKTTDPSYYKWTQWIFLKLYEKGLAYEDYRLVNWCPALGTVLANEEVIDGKSERGGFPVERRPMKQWVLKITAYADKLLEGLKDIQWPASTLAMQKNWIGKSKGTVVVFPVKDSDKNIEVFTTRADTLFGCTYVVLAPEHPLVKELTTKSEEEKVLAYQKLVASKSDQERTDGSKEKTGVFLGSYAINPINGKVVPIYIGDYVLATYGSGAVMAVPCHDQRDFDFAKKHHIEMIQVIEGDCAEAAFEGDGKHINSSFADGMNNEEAKKAITEKLIEINKGRYQVNYKLRDWLFSRQRYWGEPIPVIHMEDGKTIPVPYDQLPLTLPEMKDYKPSGDGQPPLSKEKDWVEVTVDGKKGLRETNTMPQWAGSSWYYARYIDPHNNEAIGDKKLLDHWLPVDVYVGGAEHAVLHLLYARFWHKFLHDQGIFKSTEPFQKLYHQGLVLGPDGQKMSKSLGNTVSPDDVINEYGADSLRLYEMFKGPVDQSMPWSNDGPRGAKRFLDKFYRLYSDEEYTSKIKDEENPELDFIYHATVKKCTNDYEVLHYNTGISQLMVCISEFYKAKVLPKKMMLGLAQLLAPICPHLAQECYTLLGYDGLIDYVPWPSFDENKMNDRPVTYAIQVNGKLRSTIEWKKDCSEEEAEELKKKALSDEKVLPHIQGKTIAKVIVVKNKIVSIVAK
ncbi:MAG: leucine--tRNA ligase [Candidatus Enterosoma sp.]|nr:leucine--tRNA ligase [Bacilli bacterium]MDD7180643.1 leucine--tRNA ligase [Bacilli bacterium]MDY3047128.1 leucine--tRNA ligase [Candidatus Enterosoma sp.]